MEGGFTCALLMQDGKKPTGRILAPQLTGFKSVSDFLSKTAPEDVANVLRESATCISPSQESSKPALTISREKKRLKPGAYYQV